MNFLLTLNLDQFLGGRPRALWSRLEYRAHVRPTGPASLVVTKVETRPDLVNEGPDHATDAVDHLMKKSEE